MRSTVFLAGAALATLALSACQQATNTASSQPLAAPTQAELAPAPAAAALPDAPPAPVRRTRPERLYSYIDDAYAMSQAYADAPPDYAFDYDGYAPEAWGSRDGVVRVGERVPGGWRYYYYQPGSDAPYLVRDPEYAYAFDGGQLAVVYDSRGRALDPSYADRQAWLAGRYMVRAKALWQASRDNRRREVEQQVWRAQQAEQARQRQAWAQSQQAVPEWRDHRPDQDRSRWAQTAAAWAAVQAANPPPPAQAQGPRHDQVWAERETWRQRMAQQTSQGAGVASQPQPQAPVGPPMRGPDADQQHGLQGQQQAEADRQRQLQAQQQTSVDRQYRLQSQQQGEADRQHQLQAQQQMSADRQHQLQSQQLGEVDHQRQLHAQQQTSADRQHQLQTQQQGEADRQRQLQAQQQASANRQHQLQTQQQAAAGKPPQAITPPPGHGGRPAELEPQKLQQQQRAIAAKRQQGGAATPPEHHPASSHPPR